MDVAFNSGNDNRRHVLLARCLLDKRFQIGNGRFHGVSTGNELGQEIDLFIIQIADFRDGWNEQVVNDSIGRHALGQLFLSQGDDSVLFPFQDSLIDRVDGALFSPLGLLRRFNSPCRTVTSQEFRFFLPFSFGFFLIKILHAVDIGQITALFIHEHIGRRSCIHEQILRRIGNSHGQAAGDGHGQKSGVDIHPVWQAERDIG